MSYQERPGFAERVLAVRKRRGLTQEPAAAEIGINVKYLSLIEEDWTPHEGIWGKVRAWLKREEEAAAAAAEAANDEEPEPEPEPPRAPEPPARVPAQVLLAIRRLVRRS